MVFRIQSIRDSILNNLAPEDLWYSPDAMLQNITRQPSISLPTYWTSDNLPLGVQFASRYADEETLISLAAQLEKYLLGLTKVQIYKFLFFIWLLKQKVREKILIIWIIAIDFCINTFCTNSSSFNLGSPEYI